MNKMELYNVFAWNYPMDRLSLLPLDFLTSDLGAGHSEKLLQ